MASSVSTTGNNVIHRAKGADSVVVAPSTTASSSAIEEARRMALASGPVPANNTTTTDDSAVSFSDDQEDDEVEDEDDEEEEMEDGNAAAQAAFNAAAAAAAAAAFQRQLLANFPMFHEQKEPDGPNEASGNPFETYIAAAAAAAAAANAEALIRHQQQLAFNSGGRSSRSEKRAAHDSGTDDTDLSQRSALQPSQKRRKQSKPVRISSDGTNEAHPALTAFLAAQSAAAALFQQQANQSEEYDKRQDEQEEGQLPPGGHPSMARNLAEFLTSSGAMNPSGVYNHPEEGDMSRPSSHSSASPDTKKLSTDDVAKFSYHPATSTPGYAPGSHPFLFPFLAGASPANRTSAVSTSNGGVRIFNHEAYCELCNKEFCNKYFLKTHKANKHGIYVDGAQPGNPPVPTTSAPASSAPPSSPAASQTVSTPTSTPNPPFSVAGSAPFSGAPLSLTVGAMSYPMHPPNESQNSSEPVNFSPIASTPPQSAQKMPTPMNPSIMDLFPLWSANSAGLSNSNGQSAFLPLKQQHPGGIVNPEAYCELCQKEFCNKYFLKRHKAKMHGITPPEGPPPTSSGGSKSKSKSQKASTAQPAPAGGDLIKIPLSAPPPTSSAVTSPTVAGSESGSEHPASEQENSFNLLMMTDNQANQQKSEQTNQQSAQNSQNSQNKDSLSLLKIPTPTLSNMFTSSPNVSAVDRMPKTPNMSGQQGQLFSPERLRQMGVINTEAFCEICCKEFCNKYFLRTHKFKKHGIGSMPEPSSQSGESSSNGAQNNNNNKNGTPAKDTEQKTPLNLTSSTPPAVADNGMSHNCELCQRPFQSAYLLHMHKTYFHNQPGGEEPAQDEEDTVNQDGGVQDDDDSSGSLVVKSEPKQTEQEEAENNGINISADLQKLQSMIMELNGSGANPTQRWPEKTQSQSDAGSPQFINSSAGNGGGIVKIVQQHEQSNELPAGGAPTASSTACHLCGGKEFFTPYFLQIHMQTHQQGMASNETMDAAVAAAASQLGLDRLLQDLSQSPTTGQLSNTAKRPNNRTSSSGSGASGAATRSYCQICNKELCNKYFMKTHMLKMHGIHLEASGGGAQIGGVQCDICHKELCSKYFLKVHKQNTHGIVYPDSEQPNSSKEGVMDLSFHQNQSATEVPPSPAKQTEHCPFCPKKFKTAKSLKSHVNHEHPNGSGSNATTCCYICSQPFADVVALQVHLIKSHANQLTEQANTPPGGQAESSAIKTPGTFQCSFCEFSSTSLPYLFAHERTHHADQQQQTSKKETEQQQQQQQKVQCPLCAEPLPLEQFQTHLMAHQLPVNFLHTLIPSSLPPPPQQKAPNPQLAIEAPRPPIKRNKKKLRNRRYRCSVCREKFATRQLCLTHILQLHPPIIRSGAKGALSPVSAASSLIQAPRPLCCPRCGFSTRLPHALRAHLRSQQCVPVVARNPDLQQLPPYMAVPTSGNASNNGLLQAQHAHRQDFVLQAFLLTQPDNKRRSKSSNEDTNGQSQDDGSSEDGKSGEFTGDDESSPTKSANNSANNATDDADGEEGQSCNFIPSLILLPVNRRIANPLSMTFSLTPA